MVATSASPVRQCLRAAAGWPSRVATPWCCNRLKVVHATSEKPPWATATLMFVALVGCKAPAQPAVAALTAPETEPGPPVSQPPSVAEPSPPVFTLEGYEADVRAALSGQPTDGGARFGRIMWSRVARLVPDGPVFGNSDAVRHEWGLEAILVEDGEEPRVVVGQGGILLLVQVPTDELQPLVVKPFALRSGPGARLGAGKVEVGSGESLSIRKREGDWVEVEVERTSYAGWAPADSVGWFHDHAPFADDQSDAKEWAAVTRKVALRTKPGGERLVELAADEIVIVLDRSGKQALVSYEQVCAPVDLRLTGFVPGDALGPAVGGLGLCGTGRKGPARSFGNEAERPRRRLIPGTLLLAPDSNRVVGCARADAEVAVGEGDAVFVETIWGPVAVRPAPPEVKERCLEQSVKPKGPPPEPTTAA